MEKKDWLLVLLLVVACILFIAIPGFFFLASFLPQPECVGVIRLNGEMVTQDASGMLSEGIVSSEYFAEMVKEAGARREIKSVMFEINSGGGSVVASEEMYSAAKKLNKPKVMFFREVGASGAYYLAMAGDTVISHPDALTGSIGARSTFSDMSGLLEKVGINMTTVKSGELKDMGDISRPPTDEELAIMQSIVNESFNAFKQVVLEARSGRPRFTYANFDKVLDARILSGRQAYALGLVDELGSKEDALAKAAELGGINSEEPPVCELNQKMGFFDALMSSSSRMLSTIFANALRGAALGGAGQSISIKMQ